MFRLHDQFGKLPIEPEKSKFSAIELAKTKARDWNRPVSVKQVTGDVVKVWTAHPDGYVQDPAE